MTHVTNTTNNCSSLLLTTIIITLVFTFSILGLTSSTQAQYYDELQKVNAMDSSIGAGFGWAIDVSSNYAVTGMPSDNEYGTKSGSAYILKYNGSEWKNIYKITASDAKAYEMFGRDIAIDRSTVVVTAPGDHDISNTPGTIYIYNPRGSEMVETARITSPENKNNDHFGRSVAINKNTIVVGATGTDGAGEHSGSAYVYHNNSDNQWINAAKLTAADAKVGDHFGFSSAVHNDVIVVGAPFHNVEHNNNGAAYIFRYDNITDCWIQEAKLIASDRNPDSFFGSSCSIYDDTIVIGAYRDSVNGTDSGSAYVYQYNVYGNHTWTQETRLTASDGAEYENFGRSVKIQDNLILIGSDHASNAGVSTGAVYEYRNIGNGWLETNKITASDSADQDRFGKAIGYDKGMLLVGTPNDDDYDEDAGSVYVYDFESHEQQVNR